MKRSFFAAALFTVVASAVSYGQTAIAEGKVPFDFHMGKTLMPAGDYRITESNGVLIVRAVRGEPSAMVLTLPAERHGKSSAPQLQFERYGSEYFLEDIWLPNSQAGLALHKSEREVELARRSTSESTEELALAR